MKRHFLMLAHTYVPGTAIGGFYASEKLDGMRAFWDGGISRGKYAHEVPFANTEKDGRLISRPVATGLWSRYGKVIHAPDWFLNCLPEFPLDGELYIDRGEFQTLISTTKDLVPSPRWYDVKFVVFDSPPPHVVFADGEINETNFKKKFVHLESKLGSVPSLLPGAPQFKTVYRELQRRLPENTVVVLHKQKELFYSTKGAVPEMEDMLATVNCAGGEGLILRAPTSTWIPGRVRTMLKVKSQHDAEAVVIGYTWGRATELGSKLLGLMGALIVSYNGKVFELSGFTDEERQLVFPDGKPANSVGYEYPGEKVESGIVNPRFQIGSKVTFRYRELTDAGIPKEARFWRAL